MPPLEPFPIIPITDDLIVQDEPMGSKDKFWCQLPDDVAGRASAAGIPSADSMLTLPLACTGSAICMGLLMRLSTLALYRSTVSRTLKGTMSPESCFRSSPTASRIRANRDFMNTFAV